MAAPLKGSVSSQFNIEAQQLQEHQMNEASSCTPLSSGEMPAKKELLELRTESNIDNKNGVSWIDAHLLEICPDCSLHAACKNILVDNQGFSTEELFAKTSPAIMTLQYLDNCGVTAKGIALQLHDLHRKLHIAYLAKKPRTWLSSRLEAAGFDLITAAECERALIDKEKFVTETIFARSRTVDGTCYLNSIGITAAGMQIAIQKMHAQIQEEANEKEKEARNKLHERTWWAPYLEAEGMNAADVANCESILISTVKYNSVATMRRFPEHVLTDNDELWRAGVGTNGLDRYHISRAIEKILMEDRSAQPFHRAIVFLFFILKCLGVVVLLLVALAAVD